MSNPETDAWTLYCALMGLDPATPRPEAADVECTCAKLLQRPPAPTAACA